MDFSRVFQRFSDNESCIEHLERIKWGDNPACPYCGGTQVARKAENHRVGRCNCHDCKTIFQKIKIDLQKSTAL